MILSWPAKMKGNRVVESMVSFADVLPTLCDAAGINPSQYKTDGKSFIPIITNDTENIQDEIFVHYSPRWGNWGKFHSRWVMNDGYKLYRDGRFYNTAKDSLESSPLPDSKLSEKEKELKVKFQQIMDEKENDIAFSLNDTTFNVTN
jgi:arylsulfatase A